VSEGAGAEGPAPARRRRAPPAASWIPFGIGQTKPHHFLDILRVAWENRDSIPYAWRILRHGVCDGCSLGPRGLRDDAHPGVHLCMTRLKLLRVNTMPALDPARLEVVEPLRRLDGRALRSLGRLPFPMVRRRGERGFRRVSWDEAAALAGSALRTAAPDRLAIYTTSRGLTNEVYYAAAKLARLLGTNSVDNAARLCHAASTVALKQTLGVGAATNSYADWIDTDLIVLFGTDVANNQPVALKYFHRAKARGARIAVVNPYREPGLERYWIPSLAMSALFGTRLMDDFFPVSVGGDVAFVNGVLKALIERGQVDLGFIDAHTLGFDGLAREVASQPWGLLERESGSSRADMERFAALYAGARRAVFIWSMGLTQHRFGVENVKAVVNLALARGMVGRPGCGVVPIRGHSGVQGAAECGAVPGSFPGGDAVSEEAARRLAALWGHPVPHAPGLSAPEMIEAAHRGALDALYVIGGNFLDTLPDPRFVREALERVGCLVYQDLLVNTSMLVEPAGTVVLLPGRTRYEQPGGGTVTSTERRIRFSPEIPGPRIGEARSEWEIVALIARHALDPGAARLMAWEDAGKLRAEMDRVMPLYRGVAGLERGRDSLQYGGPMLLRDGVCPGMPEGRAVFTPLRPPAREAAPGSFHLATRRGRQFNSMVWEDLDPLTGARREDVLISAADAAALGIRDGDPIRLVNGSGSFRGVARIAPVRPGTLQAFWPEVNVLIPRRLDPASREPDYNAVVRIEKLGTAAGPGA
jgi:molybdopterin-dependent oxidoreductase alpha subunit